MFEHILVVCTGNICRSPVAAAMLRQRLPHKYVACAGLDALVDHPVDKTAGELAKADSLDLSEHKARKLTGEMVQEADLILLMTEAQRQALAKRYPEATGKAMLLGQWLPNPETGGQGVDIPDPYRKSREAFTHVHILIKKATDAWQPKLP